MSYRMNFTVELYDLIPVACVSADPARNTGRLPHSFIAEDATLFTGWAMLSEKLDPSIVLDPRDEESACIGEGRFCNGCHTEVIKWGFVWSSSRWRPRSGRLCR